MKHFHRTSINPDIVLAEADEFFPTIGLTLVHTAARSHTYTGVVGTPDVPSTLTLSVRMEGGHYTFVEAHTDQIGESRADRNVKKFFVRLHRMAEPRHAILAAY